MSAQQSDADAALIERFLRVDEHEPGAHTIAILNIVSPTTTQKSDFTTVRVRTTCTADDAARRSFIDRYASQFDTYAIPMYKWFCVPDATIDDDQQNLEVLMAKVIQARVKDNLQRKVNFMKRKERCIQDIHDHNEAISRGEESSGAPTAAAMEGVWDYVEPPPKPKLEIPSDNKNVNILRFADMEAVSTDKLVVFSVVEVENNAIPGVDVLLKIHGVAHSQEAAKEMCRLAHKCAVNKHIETAAGVLDGWLQVPPPPEAKVTYDDPMHDAIYEGRDHSTEIKALKAFHESKDLERSLEAELGEGSEPIEEAKEITIGEVRFA